VAKSSLNRGEGLVLLLCVDDGAVVYVNGREITRVNMPDGKVSPRSIASKTIKGTDEGNYQRIRVPLTAWKSDEKNVLAVEVHQAALNDVDCFFDLALKTLPPPEPRPAVPAEAKAAMTAYYKKHYLGPDMKVPDGYVDGGRRMELDAEGRARSGREILLVDRPHDAELAQDLAFARSKDLAALAPLDRVQKIAERIEQRMTPPGGRHWLGPAVDDLTVEFADKPLRIGDVVDQGQAGVCRHRSLLFKLMADEAGLKAALVRGNVLVKPPHGSPHAWNEVQLDDGTRLLVDVTLNGARRRFLPVTNEFVVKHYLKPDDSPWYSTNAPVKSKAQP
jgi:transglutaminase-like putative cysteine protease